jgi:hypothetical protein
MTEASAIHILNSLTVVSWALAIGAIFTVIVAVAVNALTRIHQRNRERRLSSPVRSLGLLTPYLGSLNWRTTGRSGRHATQEASKRLALTHIRRPSISVITWTAAIVIIAVSVSLAIPSQGPSRNTLPKNIAAVVEGKNNTISVLETTSSGTIKLVSLRQDATNTVTIPAPNPGSAQRIGYNMLPSFGWSPGTYFGCLLDLWNRESRWEYDAEGASGSYGIPQALPGGKMASAGPDWQTNPATQIRWGLGYIKATYGDPCSAWAFEEANGYY